jgi:anti-anti-sigma factor
MNVSKEKLNDVLVLTLEGRLDTTQSDAFEKEIMQILEQGDKKIILDCSGLNYISSSGLRIFLIIQKKMMSTGGELSICKLQPTIKEVFDMSGFSMVFTIHPDLETALN